MCVRVLVCNARGLRASRLSDVEMGCESGDHDGSSWLQWHGWEICDGPNE